MSYVKKQNKTKQNKKQKTKEKKNKTKQNKTKQNKTRHVKQQKTNNTFLIISTKIFFFFDIPGIITEDSIHVGLLNEISSNKCLCFICRACL